MSQDPTSIMDESDIELPPIEERPLVTFALFAYNQEKYIREAVEGAFSQTYEPLEIILSDDCSTDRTFEIMKEMAAEYGGPHRVVLNRNDVNQNIGGHVNTIMEMMNGELLVLAAGDDISVSTRVSEIVVVWLESEKKHDSLWSAITLIDDKGNHIGTKENGNNELGLIEQINRMVPSVLGCSHAITRRIYVNYGPINDKIVYEDRVLAFRSLISGGFAYINKHLVKYRVHNQSISHNNKESSQRCLDQHRLMLSRTFDVYSQYYKDLISVKTSEINDVKTDILISTTEYKLQYLDNKMLLFSASLKIRITGFCRIARDKDTSIINTINNIIVLTNPLFYFTLKYYFRYE